MKIFDVFRRKRPVIEENTDVTLPQDLEIFKSATRWSEAVPESDYTQESMQQRIPSQPLPSLPEEKPEVPKGMDKLDFILEKLETIDARLKLIEERTRR